MNAICNLMNKIGIGRVIIMKGGPHRVWIRPIANRKGHWRNMKGSAAEKVEIKPVKLSDDAKLDKAQKEWVAAKEAFDKDPTSKHAITLEAKHNVLSFLQEKAETRVADKIEETFERANILKEKYDKAFALALEKKNIFDKFQEDEEMYDIFDTDDDDLINNFVTLRDETNEAWLYKIEVDIQLHDTIDEYTELSGEDYNYVSAQKKLDNIKANTPKDSSKSMMVHDVDYLSSLESEGTTGGIHEATTEVVKFKDESKAVYKTTSDGATVAEVSVYEVNKIVGWNVCPETVERDYGSGNGSVQKWVEGGQTPYDNKITTDEYDINPGTVNDISKILVLDIILGNFDRHDQNVMLQGDRAFMIDNEGITEPDVGEQLLNDFIMFIDMDDSDPEYQTKFFSWVSESEIATNPEMMFEFELSVINNMKHIVEYREDIINYYEKQPDITFEFSELDIMGAMMLIDDNFSLAIDYVKGV